MMKETCRDNYPDFLSVSAAMPTSDESVDGLNQGERYRRYPEEVFRIQ